VPQVLEVVGSCINGKESFLIATLRSDKLGWCFNGKTLSLNVFSKVFPISKLVSENSLSVCATSTYDMLNADVDNNTDINADINTPPGNAIQPHNKGLHAVTKLVLKIP